MSWLPAISGFLAFPKFHKRIFSNGSTYNSRNAAAGVTAAGSHELLMILSDPH